MDLNIYCAPVIQFWNSLFVFLFIDDLGIILVLYYTLLVDQNFSKKIIGEYSLCFGLL